MAKQKIPEIINVSEEALEGIKLRLAANSVLETDKEILLSVLSSYQWLYRQLRSAKLSMHRLKKLFGFSTEKRVWLKKKKDPLDADASGEDFPGTPAENNGELATKKP